VLEVLQHVSSSKNIFDSVNHGDLAILKEYIPILIKFLHAVTDSGMKRPSDVVCEILAHILDVCQALYSKPPPPPPNPTSHQQKVISVFFPQLPLLTGKGKYAANQLLKPTREIPAEKFPVVIPLFCQGYSQSSVPMASAMGLR